MIDSVLVYLGCGLMFIGVISLLRPLRFLHIRTRRIGAAVAAGGLVLALITLALPVHTKNVSVAASNIDRWRPEWQFAEKHITHVQAPPEGFYAAIRAVRANEVLLFRTLTAIRRCGQSGPENILNAPQEMPLLDVATRGANLPSTGASSIRGATSFAGCGCGRSSAARRKHEHAQLWRDLRTGLPTPFAVP